MRTVSRGQLHRRALRLGLVSVTAVFVSACSSDSDRLSFFGVDRAQPTTVVATQPVMQPQYVQPVATAPQFQPAPYSAPTYVAPGYPQTTASITQPSVQVQPTYQALPQPITAQPNFAVAQRSPVSAPNAHLATTPAGLVGAQRPASTQIASVQVAQPQFTQPQFTQPQPVYQQPVYQQPVYQAPITTASINAPQSLLPDQMTTASIMPASQPAQMAVQTSREAGWSAVGGTRVAVGQGENLVSMSRRYGIPVDVLQRVNNIPDPAAVVVGQQIIIPVYSTASVGTTPAAAGVDTSFTGSTGTSAGQRLRVPAPTPRPVSLARSSSVAQAQTIQPSQAPAMPTAGSHVVSAGETLYSIARRYDMSAQQLIAANGISDPNALRIGQRLVVTPGGQQTLPQLPTTMTASGQTPAQVVASRTYTPPRPAETQAAVLQTAAVPQVATRPDAIADQMPLQFRWPIRGRVLAGFGMQSNGVRNDGVNIAVPEGASIRAAEEGEVVYAGNELEGFGNLVLVQHRGGYVTAYAHNSRLEVRRGDRVARGDIIALAGSTGDVDTPQLHFEIRRGTTPVDPTPYLPTS